ncbi:MAG: phosphoenolpyruvate-protein phosphotransferase [marine bacterium B5-7]|nr:MAG: phosphoenolpyruvate-protein phosphotransferase [marine bacterium B5-7]
MFLLSGTGIGDVAIGRALVLDRDEIEINLRHLTEDEVEQEVIRFRKAVSRARNKLESMRDELPEHAPAELSAFLGAHVLMLEDPLLIDQTIGTIRRDLINAEVALRRQEESLKQVFDTINDDYLRSKKNDIAQVVERVQTELSSNSSQLFALSDELDDRIIVVNDLTPADTVHFRNKHMAGFITNLGGPISHTAILARSLKLPAVVGLHGAGRLIRDNDMLVIDGRTGTVVVAPGERILQQYRQRREHAEKLYAGLKTLREVPAISEDNVRVALLANIELPEDIDSAVKAGADGVGLYRTEFMFMNREAPDEEEQYAAYSDAAVRINGSVTIRTLDLGADKQVDGGRSDAYSTVNPALGLRAVRLCLSNPGLFIPQLRAILRASVHGNIRIMIPMLSSLNELDQVLELVREVKNTLSRECVEFRPDIAIGGMIEVPAAAVAADLFARKLDFLSLGTNDLIQYTLAIDRVDDEVNYLYDPLHPAVLRLIRHTIEAGENQGIPVSMCGEMAGDPGYTQLLLGLGLREFSMDPATLLQVKREVLRTRVTPITDTTRKSLYDSDNNSLRSLVENARTH